MVKKKCDSNKERAICVAVFCVFWYLLAHGYRMSNNLFLHDSLLQIVGNDSAWQIALGRFVQPFLLLLRGGICNPWLVSACAVAAVISSGYLLVDLLHIDRYIGIFFCMGAMICNATVISLNVAYAAWIDFYMLSLLLSVLSVWLWEKNKIRYRCLAVICMVLSMGIYQAYIGVTIGLFIILLINNAEEDYGRFIREALLKGIGLLVAAGLYYLSWTSIRKVLNIWASNSYNGMDSVLDFKGSGFWGILSYTYSYVFGYFWNPSVFYTVVFREMSMSFLWLWVLRIANIIVALTILLMIIVKLKNKKCWQIAVSIVLILLFPLGINFACLMSKGMVHTLMTYAFLLVYIVVIKVLEIENEGKRKIIVYANILSLTCIIWSNVVFGNQVYLKASLQERATSSFMTMLVHDIETTEGFKPGETQVAFAGTVENSPYLSEIEGFESISVLGMRKTATTYVGTEAAYIKYHFNYDINPQYVPVDDEISEMKIYPERGSIRIVDGVLTVRLSE